MIFECICKARITQELVFFPTMPRASLVSLPSPAEAPVPKPGEKPIWVLGSPPDQDGSIEEAVVIDSFFGEGDTP